MKTVAEFYGGLLRRLRLTAGLGLLLLVFSVPVRAYPPAPYHIIYGLVRDQYGTPVMDSQAQVILLTPSGVELTTAIDPNLAIGINYEIRVPMDAGLDTFLYKSNALMVTTPFTMRVVVGGVTNAAIQMGGNYVQLGQPAQMTRIDLTLGVDANGDGIPDAWETAFLAAIGSNLALTNLNAGQDVAHDGRTLQQEFLLGTYPFDPDNPFVVRIVDFNGGAPVLEFPTMTGRSYTVLGSPDLQQWTPLSFRVIAEGDDAITRTNYSASVIETLQVQVVKPPSTPPVQFFKVQLQ